MNAHKGEREDHDHDHGQRHVHGQELRRVSRRRLWVALGIIASFFIVEVVGGLVTGSLALLADAGHMLTDALESNEHVAAVQDLHIWSVTSGFPVLTATIWLKPDCTSPLCWRGALREMQIMLHDRFDIDHVTLQLEPAGFAMETETAH
ncbi:MAG TPA: cation transporter [Sedimentisphaerales bacterium]|nr:cation transporter [Sedimentisphaerales bacterium]